MKHLIIRMNAMKRYDHRDLVNRDSEMQEMLGQDISLPAYRKLVDCIYAKYFRTIKRR